MTTSNEVREGFVGEDYETREVLFIEGRRDGYSLGQINRTMTVGELIEYLSQYDEDTLVYLQNDNHYTYGGVTTASFSSGEVNERQYEGYESLDL